LVFLFPWVPFGGIDFSAVVVILKAGAVVAVMRRKQNFMTARTEPISAPAGQTSQIAALQRAMRGGQAALVGPGGERLELPAVVCDFLSQFLRALERGQSVSIVPYMQELTTLEAAEFLGVSRQHLVRVLEAGKIFFHMVGTHRRMYLKDVLEYRKERDLRRHEILAEMARADVDAGVYDKVVVPAE
jgi:excisionase family DNA binding protein